MLFLYPDSSSLRISRSISFACLLSTAASETICRCN